MTEESKEGAADKQTNETRKDGNRRGKTEREGVSERERENAKAK